MTTDRSSPHAAQVRSPRGDRRLLITAAWLLLVPVWASPAAAVDDVVSEPRPRHWHAPFGSAAQFAAYDLEAECDDNERKRAAHEPSNYACFMLRDFMNAYHPGEDFFWQRSPKAAFRFVGTRRPDAHRLQEIFVHWQSFSDGLQWRFFETEVTRHLGDDPFLIVADDGARERIRNAAGPAAADRPWDVFLHRTRQAVTDQRTDNVEFPAADLTGDRYGVYAAGRLRYFTPAGEPFSLSSIRTPRPVNPQPGQGGRGQN